MTSGEAILQKQSELLDELPARIEALLRKYRPDLEPAPADTEDAEVTPSVGPPTWPVREG